MTLTAPRTIAGQVAERLKAEILAGEREPGSRLRQVEIAQRLGVSTTPVREALAMLQREGLVQLEAQRGAVVFLPSVRDLREHYEIRAALEALAAAKAAERFEPEWAAPLEAVLDEMRDGPPAERYIALNQHFHTTLYEHSGAPAAGGDDRGAARRVERLPAHLPRAGRLPGRAPRRRASRDPGGLRGTQSRPRPPIATRRHLENTVEHVAARL